MLIIKQRQVRVRMTDLTQFFGKEGLAIDQNFAFANKGKSTQDLINEMQTHGLLVDYIDTSGDLVRCKVGAVANCRPDKVGELSGYYVYNQIDAEKFVCVFGNWRTSFEGKFLSYSANDLTPVEKQDLQRKLEEANARRQEAKEKQQEEVAVYAKEKFESAEEVVQHKYLDSKSVKSYGLKQVNGNLLVGVYSITKNDNGTLAKEIKSLQYISPNGDKKFVGGGAVRGNINLIGCDVYDLLHLPNLIVCEGYATGASIYEATGVPCMIVFSANFCLTACTRLREITGNNTTKLILALDNDENQVGNTKANEVATAIPNCVVRLPSVIGDYNDLASQKGNEQVKLELMDSKFNVRQFAIRNLVNSPPQIEWLIDSFVPLAKPGILAAVGGVGKSMSMIQLSLAVATGGTWWGKKILQQGNAIIWSSEDSLDEIHRRIDALDPLGRRFDSPYDVFVVPIPDMKEPMILLREEGITPTGQEVLDEMLGIPNLKLCVFDPLQAFVTANISSDNQAGQLWGSYCSNISARIGCSTITVHHLSKTALTDNSDDAMSHRSQIRGASSIVDSVRFAIAMWITDEETTEKICTEQGIDYDRMAVVKAGMVKSNSGNVDYAVKTLIRKKAVLELLDDKKVFEWN